MPETQVVMPKKEDRELRAVRTPETDEVFVPDVDISENNDCVRVTADMPGVSPDAVEVTVDNNILTISGRADVSAPEGYQLAGQEYSVGRFRRDFRLSDGLDTGRIRARLKDGVLDVILPKREEARKRIIAVETEK